MAEKSQFTIDLAVQVQHLKELENVLELLNTEGNLSNTNANTYKSLMTKISETMRVLNTAIKDGAIGPNGLKRIASGFDNISKSVGKVVSQEMSSGKTNQELSKELDEINKKYEEQLALLEKAKKTKSELVVGKGDKLVGTQSEAMNAAAKANRGDRKGANTKAESLLKKSKYVSDVTKIANDSSNPQQKVATEALKIYNDFLADQRNKLEQANAEISEYNQNLELQKRLLDEIKSSGGYDPDAVKALQEQGAILDDVRDGNRQVAESMEETGEQSRKVEGRTKKLETTTSKAAKSFIKFSVVIRAAQKMLKEGIKAVAEMDKALTEMSIVTGKSRKELQSMVPEFNSMGRATGATSTEMASLTAEYMKQGRTIADSKELAIQTAKAAKISGISTAESVEYMTSAINGFNLAAKDAEHVSDVFAKLGAATATDYKDLAIALSKVSAQANTAGMSIEFTTSLLAKGLEVTQEAPESIGTALKTILARMRELKDYGSTLEDDTSVNKVENALKSVGIALRDSNGQFKDMEEIFNELGPKWDNINRMQQQAIAQAVAGTRQQSRFLAIMQDWDRTVEMSNASLEAEGATMYQHAQYAKSLEFSMNKLTTAWQGFIQNLTDNDLIRDFLGFIADSLSSFTDVIQKLNELTNGGVATTTTIIVPLTLILSLLGEGISKFKEAQAIKAQLMQTLQPELDVHARRLALEQQINDAKKEGNTLSQEELDNLQKQRDELYKIEQEKIKSSQKELTLKEKMQDEFDKSRKPEKAHKKLAKKEKKAQKSKEKAQKKLDALAEKSDKKSQKRKDKLAKKQEKASKKEERFAERRRKLELDNQELLEKQNKTQALKNKSVANESAIKKAAGTQQKIDDAAELTNQKTLNAAKTQETLQENAQTVQTDIQKSNEQQQLVTKQIEAPVDAAATANETAQAGLEKGQNKSIKERLRLKMQEFGEEVAVTTAKIAGAMSNPLTIALGIGAAAILATAGIMVAIKHSKEGTNAKKELSENQNKIYENKEKKGQIDNLTSEYEELYNKRVKTDEEMARMAEIESNLGELEENFIGKTGDSLIQYGKELSKNLKDENTKLINSNVDIVKNKVSMISGIWGNSQGAEFLKSKEAQLAFKQKAELEAANYAEAFKLDDLSQFNNLDPDKKGAIETEIKKEIVQQTQRMYGSISDADIDALVAKEGSAKAAEYLANFANNAAEAAQSMAVARRTQGKSSDVFQAEMKAYNEALEAAANDPLLQDAIKTQYADLQLLSGAEESVTKALENGLLRGTIDQLAQKFNDLGISAAGLANILDAIQQGSTKDSITELSQLDDEGWREKLGYSSEDWSKLSEGKKQLLKDEVMNVAKEAVAGISHSQVSDVRAKQQSSAEHLNELKDSMMSGDELSQEQQEYLRDNYAHVYGSTAYQQAIKTGDYSQVIGMLEQNQEDNRKNQIQSMKDLATAEIADFERQTGVTYDQYLKGVLPEGEQAQSKAQQLAANIQYYNDSAKAIEEYKYAYEGLNDVEEKVAFNEEKIDKIRDKISDHGGNINDYSKMLTAANENVEALKGELKEVQKEFTGVYKDIVSIDEETQTVSVDMTKYNALSAAEKEVLDKKIEKLKEQNDLLNDAVVLHKEIIQEELDARLEMENQAIDIMKARLEAENEATHEALEKRKDIYSKYFDELDKEAEDEEGAQDRASLVNKIAMLSTATDSDSLSKLKEAQKELADLDKEQAQNARDARREAVEENFENQEEQLDEVYEKAISNVQNLWEEFVGMQQKDQEALFKKYGEDFQEVTDTAARVAAENMNKYFHNFHTTDSEGNSLATKHFATGGLVNYTGPAWVDGSRTNPEAFLDAEDTQNIARLAQGLRAILTTNISAIDSEQAASTLNIEEFNINVEGSNNGQDTGNDIAASFVNALQSLGLNVNKND